MTRLSHIAVTVVLAASAGGCALQRPAASVPASAPPQWYAPLPHEGSVADLAAWWQQLGDPVLADLVQAAQSASPTVAAARARIEEARATETAAWAARVPTVDATARAQRGNTQPPLPLATLVQAGMQASWEADLFGANAAADRAARERLAGAQAGWHEARVAVAAETATSYIGLRSCQRQVLVLEEDAQSRAETARLSQLSARAGFTAPADAELARASAADAARRATAQRAQCDVAVKALVALSGVPEPRLRERLAGAWKEPAAGALPPVPQVPAALLAQRPDVYRAEREVAAASADVAGADAQRYPRLSLTGSISAGAIRMAGQTTSLPTWSIGPVSVSLPVFDGGRRAANVAAARARYENAAAQYRAQARTAVREVEEALVQLESARARRGDAQAAAQGYSAALAATRARYESGMASLLELEDTRRTALAAQTTLVTLQQETLSAWISLYRAVGGGWSAPDGGLAAGS